MRRCGKLFANETGVAFHYFKDWHEEPQESSWGLLDRQGRQKPSFYL
ncbi:hypothetical protein HMPREF3293_02821 [Christensenella minuta]|uniref:Uncharacterized protein n=1 Tax=Christensenella minuta TaxID=626937 RepID=A0A136Q0K6_9FIRM|nr:hypothetical protein HMPREF3293_02821 [Christensenella minuta]